MRTKAARAALKARDPEAYTRMRYMEHVKKKYGLSEEQYESMRAECGNRCDSCNQKCDRLLVDHKHGLRSARGLLCNRCNVIVGYLEKNPHLLEACTKYMNRVRKAKAA